jgi:DNA mismatch repair protein MutS
MHNAAEKSAVAEAAAPRDLTPMMAQYMDVKRAHPDCLLFYRMGDFYELFFDDAIAASKALDITLTRRSGKGEDVPMCGVPWHSHESYLARLIRQGFKVAICEQVETPEEAKQRGGYKALVRRDVVRVVTQGTLTEDTLLETQNNNYLLALHDVAGSYGTACIDLSTGDFIMQAANSQDLAATLSRINPGEILVSEKTIQNPALFDVFAEYKSRLTPQPASRFDAENAKKALQDVFKVGTLDAFGAFGRAEIAAAGAALAYIDLTQKGKMPRLQAPRSIAAKDILQIDAATRRNLELTQTMTGERKGSLLDALDRTVTAAGARLLAQHLGAPLTDITAIAHRHDAVSFFVKAQERRRSLRDILKAIPDIERALMRLSLERGGPRDMAALKSALSGSGAILRSLGAEKDLPDDIRTCVHGLKNWGAHHPLIDLLTRALADDLPVLARDGGFIRRGYSPKLDELSLLRDDSRQHIAALQASYAAESGINTLKIKHNNIIGYFIEVTGANADTLFKNARFIHRQTMANASRFTTTELAELERKIGEASGKALALETELFQLLTREILAQATGIQAAASALARLDVAASQAELAAEKNYCRPEMTQDLAFDIRRGRHPVVEQSLARQNASFVANDCTLQDKQRLWLLTGPNMAGKSTFLRQNALIALMAQAGGFVPADAAKIGVVDRLFSRVGAADDLARGRSTFMVEMVETAAILNQATQRSLVILDEIGRGTSTFDGLSIAWACLEYLHDANKCRALFATHYHELTTLQSRLDGLSCHSMQVKEWQGDVVFLHTVGAGTADRSYGIHVAKLAGLPSSVVARARAVLEKLDAKTGKKSEENLAALPLFDLEKVQEQKPVISHEIERTLQDVQPDSLSPRDALDILYKLKQLL